MKNPKLILLLLLMMPLAAIGDAGRDLSIVGRREVVITTPSISLGDLAEVSSARIADDETVIGLKKISIETAPSPGETVTISAAQLLARLREEGVDLNRVAYTLPRVMSAKRASRTLSLEEIRSAVEAFLKSSGRDAALKEVRVNHEVHLLPGLVEIKAVPFGSAHAGRMGFTLSAAVDGADPVRFNVDATVDEWREVPVAGRPITRGTVIDSGDVMMARLNSNQIPRDALQRSGDVVGFAASHDLNYGEFFRTSKVEMPMAVNAGDRITMIYRKGLLEASAKGIAVDAGIIGQSIRIRNESSKRTVSGRIKEPGLVEVES